MDEAEQADAIEACARIASFGPPHPRLFFSLVDRVVEARNGWRGKKPIGRQLDSVLDAIYERAAALRLETVRKVLSETAQPETPTRH